MSRKKTIKKSRDDVEIRYSNPFAQMVNMINPRGLYIIGGRGISKTVDIQAERCIEYAHELPGAPAAFVSDTYINLQKLIIPSLIDGLTFKGWNYGDHYVIEEKPPSHFQPTFNKFVGGSQKYKHTLITHTGLNYTMVSLDRASAAASRSYVALQGDEVKYFPEQKIAKLTKAIRGAQAMYGHSPLYRAHTFTTDMPNPNNIGEHNWILKMMSKMNKSQILLILQTAFHLNEIKQEFILAQDTGNEKLINNAQKKLDRWLERYNKVRHKSTLFLIASSFVNVDILTLDYFEEEIEQNLSDVDVALLSMYPTLRDGERFYGKLNETHFFDDGYNYEHYDRISLKDKLKETSLGLRYVLHNEHLETGVDFGNMMSMYIGQEQGPVDRGLKFIHTLTPEWIGDLGRKFTDFFIHHKKKLLLMRYDRSGNNYNEANEDMASKLKRAIEFDRQGKATGWVVELKSKGQGNVTHQEEYNLCDEMMGESNPGLPKLWIDKYNCKEVKSSLELAPLLKDDKENIKKDKRSERKVPLDQLPMRSTNPSDAFKYYICKPHYLRAVKVKHNVHRSSPKVRTSKRNRS